VVELLPRWESFGDGEFLELDEGELFRDLLRVGGELLQYLLRVGGDFLELDEGELFRDLLRVGEGLLELDEGE
jgi:hypothetical protein